MEVLHDRGEELRGDRKIKETVARQIQVLFELLEPFPKLPERRRIVGVPRLIVKGSDEGVVGRHLGAAILHVLTNLAEHALAELLVTHLRSREADDGELVREVTFLPEVKQRRNELPLAEVARG
jgi:hypothetical protein